MRPVYFPFTYIADPVFKTLTACSCRIGIYQPSGVNVPGEMLKGVQDGRLEVRTPVTGDEEALENFLKEYRAWMHLHQGSDAAVLMARGDGIPFFNDTSVSQIRSDIRSPGRAKKVDQKKDSQFSARVFLQAAQEFDRAHQEIQRDLLASRAKEDELMRSLRGEGGLTEETGPGFEFLKEDEAGSYMAEKRLEAWTRLFLADAETPDVYITTSKSVLSLLLDRAPDAEPVKQFDYIPVTEGSSEKMGSFREGLEKYLDRLILDSGSIEAPDAVPEPGVGAVCVTMKLYRAPGCTPGNFFSTCALSGSGTAESTTVTREPENTIFGIVEL